MNSEPSDPPKTQTETAGGGIGKPPRPTAVATGGPDDDAEKLPKRFELDRPRSIIDARALGSWSIPELSFVRLCSGQAADKTNGLDDVLTALHSQYANLAVLLLGNKGGFDTFMGLSVPRSTEKGGDEFAYIGASQKIFQRVGAGVKLDDTLIAADSIKAGIKQVDKHVGCMTGVPALGGTGGQVVANRPIELLQSGLRGHHFGLLVLATPIPAARLALEEAALLDFIQESSAGRDRPAKRRAYHRTRTVQTFLQRLQSGASNGFWQTGIYYFASDRVVFVRLQSMLRMIYGDTKMIKYLCECKKRGKKPGPWR